MQKKSSINFLFIKALGTIFVLLGAFLTYNCAYAAGATYTVNSTLDTGDLTIDGVCDDGAGNCTLRAALDEANATSDLDTVNFGISTGSTIVTAGTLVVSEPVAIDATSVSTCPTPGIIINAGGSSSDVFRLSSNADGSSIKGFVIKNYQTTTGVGIRLSSIAGSTTTIACNIIGLNEDGTTASGGTSGIAMSGSSNIIIGGSTTADRNVISGNRTVSSSSGIAISGASYSDITIQGNYIGTNANGMAVNRNTSKGIGFSGASSITNITISNNLFAGKGIGVDNNNGINGLVIQKNTFNLAADGTTALAPVSNQVSAISFSNNPDAQNIQIGGSSLSNLGNIFATYPVIASVIITSTTGITIQGNLIGAGSSGESYPSAYAMILNGTSTGIKIGGSVLGEGNTIANMTTAGILLESSASGTPAASILGNGIFNNAGIGIDLAYDQDNNQMPDTNIGANINDLLDADSGVNDYLNHPVIVSAVQSGGNVVVKYLLDVPVATYPYRVEFFSNDGVASTTRFGEGAVFEGSDIQTISSAGQHFATVTITGATASDIITATVTSCEDVGCTDFGVTSEFSNISTIEVDRGSSESLETSFDDDGAYHLIKSGIYLGTSVDGDSDTSADNADVDGVTFDKTSYIPGATASIVVTASEAGYLNAWIDLDRNGTFETEIVPENQPLISGDTVLSFAVPSTEARYNARFRYTDYLVTDPSPKGEALSGEVEDYVVIVARPVTVQVVGGCAKGYVATIKGCAPSEKTVKVVTSQVLVNKACSASDQLGQNLRSGSRNGKYDAYTGAVVSQANILQKHLNRLGFNAGPIDGILGRLSDGAIKRMQKYLGTKADGYVGPLTRALINNSCGDK